MLHTKCPVNWSTGSGEDFCCCCFFITYRHGSHLGHVISIMLRVFHFFVLEHTRLGKRPGRAVTNVGRTCGPTLLLVHLSVKAKKYFKTKTGKKWPGSFWEKQVLIFTCKWPGAMVKKRPWPSILNIPSLTQLVVCVDQLSGHMLQQFLKNLLFSLFPIKKA